MLGSFFSLASALALAMVASVSAQDGAVCGGLVTDGMEGTFNVKYNGITFTVLTINGLNNNKWSNESYVLYCTETPLNDTQLQGLNLPPGISQFKVPVQSVLVEGTYTSSYVELAGGRTQIKVLEDPLNIVSPCLQAQVKNGSIVALNGQPEQYNGIDVGFRIKEDRSQAKDVWVPMSVEVVPLLRVEYIKAISLFFNNGNQATLTYEKIKRTYDNLSMDMRRIPKDKKKRIGWVKYDFTRGSWTLQNSAFTKGIITDADVTDNADISPSDFKILVSNADVIIDQTEFNGKKGGEIDKLSYWRKLAGFTDAKDPPVLDKKQVYSLDNTVNMNTVSDYLYRMPSRPDLLLRDVIKAQYPEYDLNYTFQFLNEKFLYGDEVSNRLGPENCDMGDTLTPFPYNSGDITETPLNPSFHGDPYGPPALIGGGIYGAGGDSQGGDASGGGGSKTKNIIIAVVSVAAILGAAFAFAFYKWSRRAKEDRFIELEEEMNNEIPLN
ncbi:hypothetical protein BGW39_002888 [Mortierella sp. 14UC]|nr:hypothetical protein BGW39_002888 [Mortierella sp. 14UC]